MSTFKVAAPWCFILNAGAIGDTIAATPAIKYAVDNVWNQPDSRYTVMVREYFKPLLHMVPSNHLAILGVETHLHVPHSIVYLNDIIPTAAGPSAAITPLRMSLIDYASIKLLGTVLPLEHKNYPILPLNGVSINKFNLPKRYMCICATEVNRNRALPESEVIKVAEHLLSVGITPVYLGKSERPFETYGAGDKYGSAASAIKGVIDLTDKTTIMEAAKIMAKSECVIGADTGLIHLAACSDVKIVCCYTTVRPELRLPVRHNQLGWNVVALTPDSDKCQFCQSDWWLNGWNFNECYDNNSFECLTSTTADKIINAITPKVVTFHK